MTVDKGFGYSSGTYGRMKIAFFALHLALIAALVAGFELPRGSSRPFLVAAVILLATGFILGTMLDRSLKNKISEYVENYERSVTIRKHISELFAMTDMLQAAEDHEDAGAILTATTGRLLPNFGGALYVFNNSRDRLDLAKHWNESEHFQPAQTLLPGNCWALKRGKTHINDPERNSLCCMHHIGSAPTIEVPMMARGKVHGLLMLASEDRAAFEELLDNRRLPRALADSLSLAISNISLRQKLRTQALRDPLTGLYNRRYMEDALERYVSLAERTAGATSVLMIDLDNFKKINDEHGHAKGDAILRDVASQLVAAVRPSDVVSRYGGEELVVILPDCGLDDAVHRAEILRGRIEGLSEAHGFGVTASFGVATVPDTAKTAFEVIPMADAALYRAKQAGRNCVVRAELRNRPGHEDDRAEPEAAENEDLDTLPRLAVG